MTIPFWIMTGCWVAMSILYWRADSRLRSQHRFICSVLDANDRAIKGWRACNELSEDLLNRERFCWKRLESCEGASAEIKESGDDAA